MKKLNAKQIIVITAIILSLVLSLWIWLEASAWITKVATSDSWYEYPWFGRFEITYSYFVAFIKIILIDIWIFGSANLLLKIFQEHNAD